MIEKHSISIIGHRTSLTLETEFWQELKAIAREKNISVGQLVSSIDEKRVYKNLSSNVRVFILNYLKNK